MAEVKVTVKNKAEGQQDIKKSANLYKDLNTTLEVGVASFAAATAAALVFKQAFDLSREGASINQLETSFNRLNDSVLMSPDLLNDMSEAARGTIKETDLMAGVLTLTAGQSSEMAQQFAQATPKLIEIAKAANALNPTLGDTSFLYNSIATGIKRSSPLILDNLGIVVKVGEANEKYAQQLGITVEQLTAQDKQMALLNATMEAGDQLINQVGGDVGSQADAWDRLTVQVDEGTDAYKRQIADGLMPWIQLVNGDYAKAIEDIERRNIAAAEATGDYSRALTRTEQGQRLAIASAAKTSGSLDVFIGKLQELGVITEFLSPQEKSLARAWYDQERAAIATSAAVDELNEKMERSATITRNAVTNETIRYTEAAHDARIEAMALNDAFDDTDTEAYTGASKAAERIRDNIAAAAIAERALREGARDAADELERQKAAADIQFTNDFTAALKNQEAAYGKWVTTATVVGGLSEDQQANFEELSKKAESLRDNIRSLQGGTAGLGLSEDDLNEKLQENYEQLGQVEAAMAPLAGVTTEYSDVTRSWVVDADAMNQTLFDQIAASTDNEIAITSAGIALGLYDEAQIEAALNAAIINEKINELAEAFVNGEITAGEMKDRMDDIVQNSPYTSEIEVLTDKANAAIDKTRSKLDAIDGLVAKSRIEITTVNRTEGDAGVGGGQEPGRAVGGPVMANQPYMVHANEVFVPSTSGTIENLDRMPNSQTITISFAGAIFQGTTQQQANEISTMVSQRLGA